MGNLHNRKVSSHKILINLQREKEQFIVEKHDISNRFTEVISYYH